MQHETHDLLTLVSSSYQILSQTTIRNIVLFRKCIDYVKIKKCGYQKHLLLTSTLFSISIIG